MVVFTRNPAAREVIMSTRDPVRTKKRDKRQVLVIDFRFIDSAGRRQRFRKVASVQTKAGARAEATRLMARAARTGSPVERTEMPTFASFIESHYRPLFMPRLRPATRKRYEGLLAQGVLARFGRLKIDAITKPAILAYAAELQSCERRQRSHGRTHGIDPRGPCNLVKAIVRAAHEVGLLPTMPKLPSFKQPATLPAAPSAEHVAKLLEVSSGWLRAGIALQALAGLRQGEVRALEVRDVDFKQRAIYVRRALSENEPVSPKGNKHRTVPMLPELAGILHVACASKLPRALVVTDRKGKPIRRQYYLHALQRLERKHGLEEWSSHALRHAFCSTLARHGANVEAIRALAGHSNIATTQRYVHANAADLAATISKLLLP